MKTEAETILDRIIVTGGAGFIGSNLVAELNARGHENITIVDHLGTSEKWRNLVGLKFAEYFDRAEFMQRLAEGRMGIARAILHMGACSATTERDADYLLRNNTRFTLDLARWAVRGGTRFVYASSAATYGDGECGYTDDPAQMQALRPMNMYGYSKQLADLWAAGEGLAERIVGLKYFNVYGPREDHKGAMRSMVHRAFHQVRATGELALFRSHRPDYKDGEQTRDFVYVKDAVAVTLWMMEHPQVNGVFNCGTGAARSWLDLARALFAAMEREPKIRFVDIPEAIRAKYQYHTQADLTRLRAAGYAAPFMSVEQGVRDYVETYLNAQPEDASAGFV
jgi:ADP-L-glycero-D-manno-heptose 6-epimerase